METVKLKQIVSVNELEPIRGDCIFITMGLRVRELVSSCRYTYYPHLPLSLYPLVCASIVFVEKRAVGTVLQRCWFVPRRHQTATRGTPPTHHTSFTISSLYLRRSVSTILMQHWYSVKKKNRRLHETPSFPRPVTLPVGQPLYPPPLNTMLTTATLKTPLTQLSLPSWWTVPNAVHKEPHTPLPQTDTRCTNTTILSDSPARNRMYVTSTAEINSNKSGETQGQDVAAERIEDVVSQPPSRRAFEKP